MAKPDGLFPVANEELVTRLHRALVNSTQAQFAEVGVGGDVEHAGEKRLARVIRVHEPRLIFPFANEERAGVPFRGARKMSHDDVE